MLKIFSYKMLLPLLIIASITPTYVKAAKTTPLVSWHSHFAEFEKDPFSKKITLYPSNHDLEALKFEEVCKNICPHLDFFYSTEELYQNPSNKKFLLRNHLTQLNSDIQATTLIPNKPLSQFMQSLSTTYSNTSIILAVTDYRNNKIFIGGLHGAQALIISKDSSYTFLNQNEGDTNFAHTINNQSDCHLVILATQSFWQHTKPEDIIRDMNFCVQHMTNGYTQFLLEQAKRRAVTEGDASAAIALMILYKKAISYKNIIKTKSPQ